MASPFIEVEVDDRVVKVTNPDRVYFPPASRGSGATKLDLVEYYLAVGDGIVNALFERPCMLHRFPTGLAGDKVHQKRLPAGAPEWVETVQLFFPRWKRTADELCVTELASVIWAVQMSTVEFHPWNSRRADTEKPDEWRIDLDPGPDCDWETVQRVAHVAHEVLDDLLMPGSGLDVVECAAVKRPDGSWGAPGNTRPLAIIRDGDSYEVDGLAEITDGDRLVVLRPQ